jgi:hypothetical protein
VNSYESNLVNVRELIKTRGLHDGNNFIVPDREVIIEGGNIHDTTDRWRCTYQNQDHRATDTEAPHLEWS